MSGTIIGSMILGVCLLLLVLLFCKLWREQNNLARSFRELSADIAELERRRKR